MQQNKTTIAMLLGDPAGIGPELISKLLNDEMTTKANIIIIGERQVFENGNNIFIEASGGITVENIHPYLNTGIDAISIGAITHSAINKDIRLTFVS